MIPGTMPKLHRMTGSMVSVDSHVSHLFVKTKDDEGNEISYPLEADDSINNCFGEDFQSNYSDIEAREDKGDFEKLIKHLAYQLELDDETEITRITAVIHTRNQISGQPNTDDWEFVELI